MRYSLKSQGQDAVTFKCAGCGKRAKPSEAYNLSVSACSAECFEDAFEMFMEANEFTPWDRQNVMDIVRSNPVPLY